MTEEGMSQAHILVEWSALGIEFLAIALIVSAIAASTSIS